MQVPPSCFGDWGLKHSDSFVHQVILTERLTADTQRKENDNLLIYRSSNFSCVRKMSHKDLKLNLEDRKLT